jgi:glycosyltransferase involved in cell wall biosynthesis
MNILILTQTFPLSPEDSTAHFMFDFAKGFIDLGHHVTVVLPFHPLLKPTSFKQIRITPFKYIWPDKWHKLGFGQTLKNDQQLKLFNYFLIPFYTFFGFLKLLYTVKRIHPQMISSHWILPNGPIAALVSFLTKTPLIISLPGSDVYLSQQNMLFKILSKISLKQARTIVSNSPKLLDDLGVGGKTISYPVQVNLGQKKVNKIPVIASAGRQVSKKGFDLLKKVCPNIEIISGLPINNFRKKLLEVDIFIALSIRDKAGNLDDASVVVLEAMAAGCAVITSDLPGYRKIITSGIDGLLINPNNLNQLKRTVRKLQKDKQLRIKLGQAARNTCRIKFLPSEIAKRYLRTLANPSSPEFLYSTNYGGKPKTKLNDEMAQRIILTDKY